jgi:hypothetical protein
VTGDYELIPILFPVIEYHVYCSKIAFFIDSHIGEYVLFGTSQGTRTMLDVLRLIKVRLEFTSQKNVVAHFPDPYINDSHHLDRHIVGIKCWNIFDMSFRTNSLSAGLNLFFLFSLPFMVFEYRVLFTISRNSVLKNPQKTIIDVFEHAGFYVCLHT